jgi:uncharacterized 2Fe-2S/4Fe-4S cluster protein (DUF4445 family)
VTDFRIRFLPDGVEARGEGDRTLIDAARAAGVYVGSICAGEGTCGKCRVIVREGRVDGAASDLLSVDETRRGYVLACQVRPRSDLVVEVPPESRLVGYRDVGDDSDRFKDFASVETEPPPAEVAPVVEKIALTLSAPSPDDPAGDRERLLAEVAKRRPGPVGAGLPVARELPRVARRLETDRHAWRWTWDGRVTAAVADRGGSREVLFVEPGDTAARSFGLALDIGTTTVVAHLVDLASGLTREAAAKYNSQIRFGADVIARINHARRPGGAEALRRAIAGDIETLVDALARRAAVSREEILCVVAAGNTVMTHLLLGLETDLIRLSPFVPAATGPEPIPAADLGIRIHPRGLLYVMPMAGSYVGGDITAGILASGMHRSDDLALLLDIGTNGEVVLGNSEYLVSCSASAGPAFEGGSVTCGMRAAAGAIDTVRIGRDLAVAVTTIDQAPPAGLCGTGLIDALAEMFLAGLVDRGGRLHPDRAPDRFRVSEEDGRPEFIVIPAAPGGGARDILIGQSDIENLIRTKASLYAAADSLVGSLNLSFRDIRRVYIAGAFGNRLDVARCVLIGLLPDVPSDRVHFIGNGSLRGAKLVLRDRHRMDEVRRILERMTYRELMVDAGYMEKFTSACFLPHTDLARFPSVETRLREAGDMKNR